MKLTYKEAKFYRNYLKSLGAYRTIYDHMGDLIFQPWMNTTLDKLNTFIEDYEQG